MTVTVTDNIVVVQEVDDVVTVTTSNTVVPSAGGSSVHSDLTELLDDDHTQYHNNARGDARYYQLSTDLATQVELDALNTAVASALAAKQNLDATLTALANLTIAADKLIYGIGVDVFATTDLSAFIRTLLDDIDAITARLTLGVIDPIVQGSLIAAASTYLTVPGVSFFSTATQVININQFRFCPMIVVTPITIDLLTLEVTGAGVGGTVIRMGIYNADSNWVPTTLVIDAGTVAGDSLGQKSISITQVLQPGRYYLTLQSNGSPTLRTYNGTGIPGFILSTMGSNIVTFMRNISSTYGVFPESNPGMTSANPSNASFTYFALCRVSVP